jgi:putative restriction endonuclease
MSERETEMAGRQVNNRASEAFEDICSFCRRYNHAPATKTDSIDARIVIRSLEALKFWADTNFQDYEGMPLKVEISRGKGFFPRVPWLAILPPQQRVSDGVYFVVCFGREGAGAVAGCASSVTTRTGLATVIRSKYKPLAINVNGDRASTLYNDAFANPLEINKNAFNEDVLKEHFRVSMQYCFYYIKSLQNPAVLLCDDLKDLSPIEAAPDALFASSTAHTGIFDPSNIEDARKAILSLIKQRQGQPKFRLELLRAYDSKCAITDCHIVDVLEAAHIVPYRGLKTNHVSNGLLLRADLHTLYDKNLISIDPLTMTVVISPDIADTEYSELAGKSLRVPRDINQHPNKEALAWRRLCAGI